MQCRSVYEEVLISEILLKKGINHIWDMNIDILVKATSTHTQILQQFYNKTI